MKYTTEMALERAIEVFRYGKFFPEEDDKLCLAKLELLYHYTKNQRTKSRNRYTPVIEDKRLKNNK